MAHTIVIGSSPEKKVTGKKADVVLAAYYASQAALRLLKPGTEVGLRIPCYIRFVFFCEIEIYGDTETSQRPMLRFRLTR